MRVRVLPLNRRISSSFTCARFSGYVLKIHTNYPEESCFLVNLAVFACACGCVESATEKGHCTHMYDCNISRLTITENDVNVVCLLLFLLCFFAENQFAKNTKTHKLYTLGMDIMVAITCCRL